MACEESVYLASILLLIEALYRFYLYRSNLWFDGYDGEFSASFMELKGHTFVFFFAASLAFSFLYVNFWQNHSLWSITLVQSLLPFMYMFDPIGAILIGYGQLNSDFTVFVIGLLILTNLFMIHVLQRIFAKKKPVGLKADMVATVKAVIHHMANFYYVDDPQVIIYTVIWRAVSMSGHTAQAFHLKKWIDEHQLYQFNWLLSHARNIILSYIILQCFTKEYIRLAFARSAIGHIGYMVSRAGPVFRLGSCYVGDKALWQSHSDWKRIEIMLSGQFPFITIEVGSLVLFSLLLLYWRLTAVSIIPFQFSQ